MNTPNDTLLTSSTQNIDTTISPKTDNIKKKDITHHPKRKNRRTLTRGRLNCIHCGQPLEISDTQYKMIVSDKYSRQAKLQSRHMGRRERHRRAVLAGLARAQKAGQTLKQSTIQKCTSRKIYKDVAFKLEI